MKILGIIPARWASTRLPGKPLISILDKTLIEWTLEGALASQKVHSWLVATDDVRILKTVQLYAQNRNIHSQRLDVVLTDPSLQSGTDRIYSAYCLKKEQADIIVNVQGDEPLLTGDLIDQVLVPLIAKNNCQMSTLAHPIHADDLDSPHVVKVICDKNHDAIYFSRFAIPYSRGKKTSENICYKHMGIYAYRTDFLKEFCQHGPCALEEAESLEQLRALYIGGRIAVNYVAQGTLGVDVPEDVQKVEHVLKIKYGIGKND